MINRFSTRKIPMLNNSYVISLIGSNEEIEQASEEIKRIAETIGHTVKMTSIKPTVLSAYYKNEMPKWRKELENEIKRSGENIIINKIGHANCDEIRDFNRSVRALALNHHFRHPWAFKIDASAKTRHESNLLGNDPNKFNCDQINQVYPLAGTYETKYDDLNTYIRKH